MKIYDKEMIIDISGRSTEYIPKLHLHVGCFYNIATPVELAPDLNILVSNNIIKWNNNK